MDKTEREAYTALAGAIIEKAVSDWRLLIQKKAYNSHFTEKWNNLEDIRKFFKSEYCRVLMIGMELKPETILAQLEKELEEAKILDGT